MVCTYVCAHAHMHTNVPTYVRTYVSMWYHDQSLTIHTHPCHTDTSTYPTWVCVCMQRYLMLYGCSDGWCLCWSLKYSDIVSRSSNPSRDLHHTKGTGSLIEFPLVFALVCESVVHACVRTYICAVCVLTYIHTCVRIFSMHMYTVHMFISRHNIMYVRTYVYTCRHMYVRMYLPMYGVKSHMVCMYLCTYCT